MTQDSTMAMSLPAERRRPFGDLTLTQVAASALAAVTSLAFSRHIGIAGSLIGAAVGSVSASVAGALYRSAITTSVEKVREVTHHGLAFGTDGEQPSQTLAAQPANEPVERPHISAFALVRRVVRVALALAVALLVGVLSVDLFAYGVVAATGGEGIGPREPIIQTVPAESDPAAPEEVVDAEAPADDQAVEDAESATTGGDSQQAEPTQAPTDTMVENTNASASAPQDQAETTTQAEAPEQVGESVETVPQTDAVTPQ